MDQCRFVILITLHKNLWSDANGSEYRGYTRWKSNARSIGPEKNRKVQNLKCISRSVMYRRYFSSVFMPFVCKSKMRHVCRVSPSGVLGAHFGSPQTETWISQENTDFWVRYFPLHFFTESKFLGGSTLDLGATHDEDHEYTISFVRSAFYHVFSAIQRQCPKRKFRMSIFSPVTLIHGSNSAHVTYILYAYHVCSIYNSSKHSTWSANWGFRKWSTPTLSARNRRVVYTPSAVRTPLGVFPGPDPRALPPSRTDVSPNCAASRLLQ
jgi:hypothetical protein